MRLSLNWLNDYVDLRDLSTEQIAKTLTDLGLEVEEVEELRPIPNGVVVGRVLTAAKHPNADTLTCCMVDIGQAGEPLKIVCGAPNARAGIQVAVATVGTEFSKDFKIKATKLRGEPSEGMLCSEKELGLSEAHDGIIELKADLPLGQSVGEILKLNDTVITIGLTPNRADCFGYIGVARDLAGKLGRPLKVPEGKRNDKVGEATGGALAKDLHSKDKVRVVIEDESDCPRFVALYVQDVTPVASPLWMQKRLEAAGMRPINVIVDATNYVMLENSHPVHAYDERDVHGGVIHVRRAKDHETLKTLDGQDRVLQNTDLMICDARGPIGLAGVMGGENSEVKSDTRNIIIEAAVFSASLVRKSSKRFGLHTEASHRFERGVDVNGTARVAWRVAEIIQSAIRELKIDQPNLAVPKIAQDVVDTYPNPLHPGKIALRLERVRRITGMSFFSQEDCIRHLQSIGIKLIDKTDERMLFEIPTWRHDIEREVDLIEEAARLHGYEKINTTLPLMEIGSLPEDPFVDFMETARKNMALCGMAETMSFPFLSDKEYGALQIPASHPLAKTITLQNPLSEDMAILTPTLAINLLRAVVHNRSRGMKGARLFEVAKTFHNTQGIQVDEKYAYWRHLDKPSRHISPRAQTDTRPVERATLGAILDQPLHEKTWREPATPISFFDAKGLITQWLGTFGVRDLQWELIAAESLPWLHPKRSAVVRVGNIQLGYVGEVHPKTCVALGLDPSEAPLVMEIDLNFAFSAYLQPKTYDSIVRRFPPSLRDLALVVNQTVTHKDVLEAVAKFKGKKYLSDCQLFDVYQGKNIPDGKKSMAYSISFQSPEKTLTDKDVEKEIEALLAWLKQSLAAELR